MLRSIKQLYRETLRASDGDIGHVKDFYFDDTNWAVRYVVADTGSWLSGRQVLLAPHAFGNLYQDGKVLLVNLTRKQIENSPSIETHKPVSVDWISHEESKVFVKLTKETILQALEYHVPSLGATLAR